MRKNYWANFEPEHCYHIYNKTVGGNKLFTNEGNYDYFLRKYWQYLGSYLSTYSYALIPNHFHFLAKCKYPTLKIKKKIERENTKIAHKYLSGEVTYHTFIASQFKRFFKSYVDAFNIQEKRRGTLFAKKFKRVPIENKAHFEFMLLYHHHNGIHHKLVEDYGDWSHTSYGSYLNEEPTNLAKNTVLKHFRDEKDTSGVQNFIQFHEENKNGIGGFPNLIKYKDSTCEFYMSGSEYL